MSKLFEVLYTLNNNKDYSQRDLSKACAISIGSINMLIKEAQKMKYIEIERTNIGNNYSLTAKGILALETYLSKQQEKKIHAHVNKGQPVKSAVILAAGKRAEFQKPVALLELAKERIIDRTIRILHENKIEHIVIVTGYKSELFEEIARKNTKITIIGR